jgi:hypothetical protein
MVLLETFFFSRKPFFFGFTTLIQLPMHMAGVKITFSIIFFDMVPQTPALKVEWVQKAPFGAYLQFLVLQLLEIAPS